MIQACDSCVDEARERNRDMESLRDKAKQQAKDEQKAKAICKDETTGLFIADAKTAIAEHFQIVEFISGLQ